MVNQLTVFPRQSTRNTVVWLCLLAWARIPWFEDSLAIALKVKISTVCLCNCRCAAAAFTCQCAIVTMSHARWLNEASLALKSHPRPKSFWPFLPALIFVAVEVYQEMQFADVLYIQGQQQERTLAEIGAAQHFRPQMGTPNEQFSLQNPDGQVWCAKCSHLNWVSRWKQLDFVLSLSELMAARSSS